MAWIDRERKKEHMRKLVRQAMKSPEFMEARKKERFEDIDNACRWFLTISVDYLYRHENYGKKRMQRFIDFVNEQFKYVEEDPEYFKLLAHELEKETGINCFNLGDGKTSEKNEMGISDE